MIPIRLLIASISIIIVLGFGFAIYNLASAQSEVIDIEENIYKVQLNDGISTGESVKNPTLQSIILE